MPKISTYIKDNDLDSSDAILATEAVTNRTVNIPLGALSSFIGGGDAALTQAGIEAVLLDDPAFRTSIGIVSLTATEYRSLVLVGTDVENGVQSNVLYNVTDDLMTMADDLELTQIVIEDSITDDPAFRTSIGIITLTTAAYDALVAVGTDVDGGVQSDILYHITDDLMTNEPLTQSEVEDAITDDPAFRTSIGAGLPITQARLEAAITDDDAFRLSIGLGGTTDLTQSNVEDAIIDDSGFRTSIGAGVPVTQTIIETAIVDNSAFRTSVGLNVTQDDVEDAITDNSGFRTSIGAGIPVTQTIIETAITNNDDFRSAIGVATPDALTQNDVQTAIVNNSVFRADIGAGTSEVDITTTTGSETVVDGTDTLNVVTRDTNQTISGDKTLTGSYNFTNADVTGLTSTGDILPDVETVLTSSGQTVVAGSNSVTTVAGTYTLGNGNPGANITKVSNNSSLTSIVIVATLDGINNITIPAGRSIVFKWDGTFWRTLLSYSNAGATINFDGTNGVVFDGSLLNHYSEGSWFPSAGFLTNTDGTTNYANRIGSFARTGNTVRCLFQVTVPQNTTNNVMVILNTSLPYTPLGLTFSGTSTGGGGLTGSFHPHQLNTLGYPIGWLTSTSNGTVIFAGRVSSTNFTARHIGYSDIPGAVINGGFSYLTNDA